jgi:hypothetical protein
MRGEIIDTTQYSVINIGQPVPMVAGNKTTEGSALAARVLEDLIRRQPHTRPTWLRAWRTGAASFLYRSTTVRTEISSPLVIGALFLLTPDVYNAVTESTPICAEYIGLFVQGSVYGGTGDGLNANTGGYLVRLVQ